MTIEQIQKKVAEKFGIGFENPYYKDVFEMVIDLGIDIINEEPEKQDERKRVVKKGVLEQSIKEWEEAWNNWLSLGAKEDLIRRIKIFLENPEQMPSGQELLQLWKGKFREGAGKILQYVYENYPNEISKEEIGMAVGFEPSGGTFNTYISELRRNGLVEVSTSGIKISEEFF